MVYVDAQLQSSRRFDAAGIERDHPELFEPFPYRRGSYGSAGPNGREEDADPKEQGQ